MAAWRPRRCRAISRGDEPGATGACYGCAQDASGASGPRARGERTGVVKLVRRVCCARGVRDALVWSGSSGARGTYGTHWGGRARRVRAGRAGRRGTSGVCRRRRRSSACVAGVVTEHGATGVGAPGRVRRLGHARDDDNNGSSKNFDDGEPVKIMREIVSTMITASCSDLAESRSCVSSGRDSIYMHGWLVSGLATRLGVSASSMHAS
ncbi:hypothetical protein VPH35_013752 [Triticum aestivum]